MNQMDAFIYYLAAGLVIGLVTLTWRGRMGTGQPWQHLALWAAFWAPILVVLVFWVAPSAAFRSWVNHQKIADKARYQAAQRRES